MWYKQECGHCYVSLNIDEFEGSLVSLYESLLQLYNALNCSIVNDVKISKSKWSTERNSNTKGNFWWKKNKITFPLTIHTCPGDLSTSMWVPRDNSTFLVHYSHVWWRNNIQIAKLAQLQKFQGNTPLQFVQMCSFSHMILWWDPPQNDPLCE